MQARTPADGRRTVGSGVVQETDLAGPAVRRVAELGQGLVGAATVRAQPVDRAVFLAGGALAAELVRDPHQLADRVRRGALLAEPAPEGVLVAAAGVQAEGD